MPGVEKEESPGARKDDLEFCARALGKSLKELGYDLVERKLGRIKKGLLLD